MAADAAQRVKELRGDEHQASRERAALHARAEALQLSLRAGTDAAGAVLADPDRFCGVLGPMAALLSVDDGAQAAVAAALGVAADAIAVTDLDAAAAVIAELRRRARARSARSSARARPIQAGRDFGRRIGRGRSERRGCCWAQVADGPRW